MKFNNKQKLQVSLFFINLEKEKYRKCRKKDSQRKRRIWLKKQIELLRLPVLKVA